MPCPFLQFPCFSVSIYFMVIPWELPLISPNPLDIYSRNREVFPLEISKNHTIIDHIFYF